MRTYKNINTETVNNIEAGDYIVKSVEIDSRRMNSGKISKQFVPSKLFLGMQVTACAFMIWAAVQLMIG